MDWRELAIICLTVALCALFVTNCEIKCVKHGYDPSNNRSIERCHEKQSN